MLIFVLLAALMLAAALAFVLPTLLQARAAQSDPSSDARRKLRALDQARAEGILNDAEYTAKRGALGEQVLRALDNAPAPSRSGFYAALGIALLLPASAIVLYRVVGAPQAINAPAGTASTADAPADHEQNMDQAIGGLEAKLKENPKDAEGWTLLGRAYESTERFADARDALKHARDLLPEDADIMVAYAEALALSSDTRRIEGEPRTLLEAALKAAPQNQRGLWLLGISDYQAKKYDAAIGSWKRLLAALPKDAPVAKSVQREIAKAEAARDGRAPPPDDEESASTETASADTPAPSAPTPASGAGPHLTVKVALDAKLQAKLASGDVLFVYAKAASGPPMPVAIQRLQASVLPTTVVLSDGMGMMPSLKLSQFPQVIIGARISKSGNAIAQSGDLQTISKPLAVTTTAPIELTIDQVVP